MRVSAGFPRGAVLALAIFASGCAARGFVPPDPASALGAASASATEQWEAVSERCRAQQALAAEGALSGRVAGGRVRGRIHLGLTRTGGVRLEAVAPFGAPVFVLAGTDRAATLVLPRDARTYEGEAADIIDALAGVRLTATELLAVANGCLGAEQQPSRFVSYRGGLTGVSLPNGVELWLQGSGASARVVALRRGDLLVDYPEQISTFPLALRLRRAMADGRGVDLRLRLSQVERNGQIDDAAFHVEPPAGAQPLTLDELRRAGLLAGR